MRYAAFLRAINVGGRVVKMDALRREFGAMAFTNVETFIASGNVVFDSSLRSVSRVEQTVEQALQHALGYPVATFVRSMPELVTLARHPLFGGPLPNGTSLFVAFTRQAPSRDVTRKLLSFNNDVDEFHVHEHHVLWLRRGAFHDSKFSGALLEKTLGMPATVRNSTTVRKMAQKFGGA
jgi:uncharacterized protein (DUF1697 family)